MQCPSCHAPLPDGASFCDKCGSAVSAPATPGGSAEDENAAALIGKTIDGKYHVTRLLGEGGMGCVYVAEQMLGTKARNVAIKTLHKHLSEDEKIRERFQREVGTVAELEHPNTIQVFDYGAMPDGLLYIVMEYVQGESIASVIEKEGHIDPSRVRHIVQQVGGSLEEAHAHGIVHRDLKPDNVVLTFRAGQKDFVKVLDFGIAKRSHETDPNEKKLTQQGMVLGTPQYMAPEQFLGKPLDARADIYAMGVMAYEMLTGQLPFAANTAWEWATQHMTQSPRAIETQPNGTKVPEAMRRAIRRALEKDPAARFSSMREMVDAFSATSESTVAPEYVQNALVPDPGALGRGKTQIGEPLLAPSGSQVVAQAYAPPVTKTEPPFPAAPGVGTVPQPLPMGGPIPGGPMNTSVPVSPVSPAIPAIPPGPGAPQFRAQTPQYGSRGESDESDGGRKKLLIAAAVIGLLTIGGVAAATLWPSGPKPIPPENIDTTGTSAATSTATSTAPDNGGGNATTEPSSAPLGGGGGGGSHAGGGGGNVPPHHPDAGKPATTPDAGRPPPPNPQPNPQPPNPQPPPNPFPFPLPSVIPTIIPTVPPAQPGLPPAVQAACNTALAARQKGIPNPSAEKQCRDGGGKLP